MHFSSAGSTGSSHRVRSHVETQIILSGTMSASIQTRTDYGYMIKCMSYSIFHFKSGPQIEEEDILL